MNLYRVLACALLLLAAPLAFGGDRATAVADLTSARARWAAAGINNYEIRFRDEACFCMYGPYYGPIRNVVKAGKLRASYYEGERRDGYWFGRKVRISSNLRATVGDVFARVERLIATAPEGTFKVQYDATYGFPILVAFDDPAWEDEQWRLVADGFKPMGPKD